MKIKISIITATLAVTLLTVSSCSFFEGTATHREKGSPIPSTEESVNAFINDNNGKRGSVIGYLNYHAFMRVYTNRPQNVNIMLTPGEIDTKIATVEMSWSENGHNSVFVPKDAGEDEKKTIFYDNEGNALKWNDKVIVSFELEESSKDLIEVRIDKAK
ncbi:hypothetical protein ABIB40_002894 [Pedobacter sp. UYP30]|uniref:hypothetical protein n=1 Tax=Pedobacter sp. UYP30 TaxID=1756400 RepID=UPI003398E540